LSPTTPSPSTFFYLSLVFFFVEKYSRSINVKFSVLKPNENIQLLATNTYERRSNNRKALMRQVYRKNIDQYSLNKLKPQRNEEIRHRIAERSSRRTCIQGRNGHSTLRGREMTNK
jgi:hypothetical protein